MCQSKQQLLCIFSQMDLNRTRMTAAGAVPLLVTLLRSDPPGVQEQAAAALYVSAYAALRNKDAVIAAGTVPLLVHFLRSDKPDVQETAAAAL